MKRVIVEDWCLRPNVHSHCQRTHLEIEAKFNVFDLNTSDMNIAHQSMYSRDKMLDFLKELFRDQKRVARVVRNGPATILFWDDCAKTVVKLQDGDTNDPEKAIMAGMLKRLYPNWQDVIRNDKESIGVTR